MPRSLLTENDRIHNIAKHENVFLCLRVPIGTFFRRAPTDICVIGGSINPSPLTNFLGFILCIIKGPPVHQLLLLGCIVMLEKIRSLAQSESEVRARSRFCSTAPCRSFRRSVSRPATSLTARRRPAFLGLAASDLHAHPVRPMRPEASSGDAGGLRLRRQPSRALRLSSAWRERVILRIPHSLDPVYGTDRAALCES